MNRLAVKSALMHLFMGSLAISVGAGVVLAGDYLLGINLELFYGISTFSPTWILALFVVPFIAGIVVSMIYGLGGKILAHFSPLIVHVTSYIQLSGATSLPEGALLLPVGYWLLVVIVAVEFSALGGIVGEIIIKRTYGRTSDKRKLHKKFQHPDKPQSS